MRTLKNVQEICAHPLVINPKRHNVKVGVGTVARHKGERALFGHPRNQPPPFDAVDSPDRCCAKTSMRSLHLPLVCDLIETPASTHIKMPGRTRPIDKFAAAVGKCSAEVCILPSRWCRCRLSVGDADVVHRALCMASAYLPTTTTCTRICVRRNS